MIELVAQDGARLFVNPDAIWHVRSNGADYTAIYGYSGAALFVRGGVEEVAARIEEGRRAENSRQVEPPHGPAEAGEGR